MPTPMRQFADIARRHGVDPTDEDAVDDFFARVAPTLPKEQQALLFSELLQGDVPPVAAESAAPSPAQEEHSQEPFAQVLREAHREKELRFLQQFAWSGLGFAALLSVEVAVHVWRGEILAAVGTTSAVVVMLVIPISSLWRRRT